MFGDGDRQWLSHGLAAGLGRKPGAGPCARHIYSLTGLGKQNRTGLRINFCLLVPRCTGEAVLGRLVRTVELSGKRSPRAGLAELRPGCQTAQGDGKGGGKCMGGHIAETPDTTGKAEVPLSSQGYAFGG